MRKSVLLTILLGVFLAFTTSADSQSRFILPGDLSDPMVPDASKRSPDEKSRSDIDKIGNIAGRPKADAEVPVAKQPSSFLPTSQNGDESSAINLEKIIELLSLSLRCPVPPYGSGESRILSVYSFLGNAKNFHVSEHRTVTDITPLVDFESGVLADRVESTSEHTLEYETDFKRIKGVSQKGAMLELACDNCFRMLVDEIRICRTTRDRRTCHRQEQTNDIFQQQVNEMNRKTQKLIACNEHVAVDIKFAIDALRTGDPSDSRRTPESSRAMWAMDGSELALVIDPANEESRRLLITKRNGFMRAVNVPIGSTFFEGTGNEKAYVGLAYAFYLGCAPQKFRVRGIVADGGARIIFSGNEPVLNKHCIRTTFRSVKYSLLYLRREP